MLNWGVAGPYVEQSAFAVLKTIIQSVVSQGRETSVQTLAEAYINPKLDEELSALDIRVRAVYDQLLRATLEKVAAHSMDVIGTLLQCIKMVTGDPAAGEKFIKSFVLIETRELFAKLNEVGFFTGDNHV
jgi:hypothetical protein